MRRDEGRSIREIAEIVEVSKSSVSLWVRDIELTADQHAALFARNPAYNGQRVGAEAKIAKYRAIREEYQQRGRALALQGDPFFAAGCMLYWAEGRKSRTTAQMTNSDPPPEVLRFFVAFLRRYFGVVDDQFAVTCNLFADHLARQREIEQFWLDTLWAPAAVPAEVDREHVLEVQPEEAAERAALRHHESQRVSDAGGPDDLRGHSGARRLRSARVARLA